MVDAHSEETTRNRSKIQMNVDHTAGFILKCFKATRLLKNVTLADRHCEVWGFLSDSHRRNDKKYISV